MKKLLLLAFVLVGAAFTTNAQTANTMTEQERMEKHQEFVKQKEAMAAQKEAVAKKVEATTGEKVNAKYTADQKATIAKTQSADLKVKYQGLLDSYKSQEKTATSADEKARLQAAIQELEEKISNMK